MNEELLRAKQDEAYHRKQMEYFKEKIKLLTDSQESIGDESSMSVKASIHRPSDELSNLKEDSCKPKTLPDNASEIENLMNKDYSKTNFKDKKTTLFGGSKS